MLVGGLAAVVGTLTLVVNQFVDGVPELTDNASERHPADPGLARDRPAAPVRRPGQRGDRPAQNWINANTSSLTATGVATAATLFEVLTGALLVLFATFFFLRDGRKIWRFLVRLFPVNARWQLADAGEASWATLGAYVRATVLVAFIDAVGIGLALVILEVPFAFPLAALVFLGAFIPIVGASVSGAVAVLVALVDQGWVIALIVLGAVIVVQQIEGHVLQPLIMGRAVAIHPLVVIIGIASGVVLAGIVGALVAVPLIAVLNTGIRRLARRRPEVPPGRGSRSPPPTRPRRPRRFFLRRSRHGSGPPRRARPGHLGQALGTPARSTTAGPPYGSPPGRPRPATCGHRGRGACRSRARPARPTDPAHPVTDQLGILEIGMPPRASRDRFQ